MVVSLKTEYDLSESYESLQSNFYAITGPLKKENNSSSPYWNTMEKLNWLLTEEQKMMEQGMDSANRLLNWFYERISCLEKRQRTIGKSCFPAELAFHEEKLILLQERIEQLNHFVDCVVGSSEKTFNSPFSQSYSECSLSHANVARTPEHRTISSDEVTATRNSHSYIPQQRAFSILNNKMTAQGNNMRRYSLNQTNVPLFYENGVQATLM
uniref:Uncharacterized protein n=1 Tax=Trichuris muris TaxID=70415 RepID=A0A5S6QUF4_TRIMR